MHIVDSHVYTGMSNQLLGPNLPKDILLTCTAKYSRHTCNVLVSNFARKTGYYHFRFYFLSLQENTGILPVAGHDHGFAFTLPSETFPVSVGTPYAWSDCCMNSLCEGIPRCFHLCRHSAHADICYVWLWGIMRLLVHSQPTHAAFPQWTQWECWCHSVCLCN